MHGNVVNAAILQELLLQAGPADFAETVSSSQAFIHAKAEQRKLVLTQPYTDCKGR